MLAHIFGVVGIVVGFAALALNVAAIRAAPTSRDSRRRRFVAICASVLGVAACPVTFVIGVQGFTVEGPALYYGWPFIGATTDRFAHPVWPEWIAWDFVFWFLAPQILVYAYERLARAKA